MRMRISCWTWDSAKGRFVQRIEGGQARGKELAIHDPLGTTFDISEPQSYAQLCNAVTH